MTVSKQLFLNQGFKQMLFRDFYQEVDRNNRRWRVIFGLASLAIFAYIAFVIAMCSNQPTEKDIEQMIVKSSNLRNLDNYCQDIPKPSNFNYSFKTLGGNSLTYNISYWYQSDSSFREVRDFYISYFNKEGWMREDLWDDERSALPKLLKYRKEKRTISLERVSEPNADYSFDCSLDK